MTQSLFFSSKKGGARLLGVARVFGYTRYAKCWFYWLSIVLNNTNKMASQRKYFLADSFIKKNMSELFIYIFRPCCVIVQKGDYSSPEVV